MSSKYNYNEFKKIVSDFVKDLLVTFPEEISRLDSNLLLVFKETNLCKTDEPDKTDKTDKTDDSKEYSENYKETEDKSSNEDSDELKASIQAIFEHCCTVYPERFFDILYQNTDIFNKDKDDNDNDNDKVDTVFLPGMDFSLLWHENISDKTRENIWKYLQLILFSIITNVDNKNTFGDTAKLFEAINEDEFREKLEDTIKGLENIFDISNLEQTFDQEQGEGQGEGQGQGEDQSKNIFDSMPDPKQIHDHINGIMNGKLGELAKELAEETAKDFDFSEESIKDPKDIFKTLFKNPQKLMNLVKNVGSKLDEKMKSGDINESELLEEASNMFNNMKSVPGMENTNMKDLFNNLNIGDMMKNMGMMPKGGKFNQNAFNSKMEEMSRSSKMRERMKARADSKTKQEQEKEQKQKPESAHNKQQEGSSTPHNVQNSIQKNLDFLFSNSDGSDLSRLNGDLQKLVEGMKTKTVTQQSHEPDKDNTSGKKKRRGKKA